MKTSYLRRALLHGVPPKLLMGVLLAFLSGSVQAATFTETVPFTILAPSAANFPPQTVAVSTPKFNPSLGTLTATGTSVTGTVNTDLEFFSTGAGGSFDIILSDALSLAVFEQDLTGTVPANQAVFDVPVKIPFGPLDRTNPLAAVVGTGTWDQVFSLPYPSLSIKQSPATALVPGLALTGTSVTTYTYTPAIAAVPEPRFILIPGLLFAAIVATLTKDWNK